MTIICHMNVLFVVRVSLTWKFGAQNLIYRFMRLKCSFQSDWMSSNRPLSISGFFNFLINELVLCPQFVVDPTRNLIAGGTSCRWGASMKTTKRSIGRESCIAVFILGQCSSSVVLWSMGITISSFRHVYWLEKRSEILGTWDAVALDLRQLSNVSRSSKDSPRQMWWYNVLGYSDSFTTCWLRDKYRPLRDQQLGWLRTCVPILSFKWDNNMNMQESITTVLLKRTSSDCAIICHFACFEVSIPGGTRRVEGKLDHSASSSS